MNIDFPVSIFQGVGIGLVFAIIASFIAIAFTRRMGLIDAPGGEPHKIHTRPVPVAGGIALLIVLTFGWIVKQNDFGDLWKVLLPASIVFAVGIRDDFQRVRFWMKLVLEIFAACLLITFGIQVHVIAVIFEGIPAPVADALDLAITILWLVGMTNAYNFVDSTDGLVLGIAIITSIFLAFTSLFSDQTNLAHFMAFLAGTCYGLYYFNSYPARFFLGDSGSLTLGFLLAATSMLYNPRIFPQPSSWFVPVMILGVPIFDILLVIFSRLRRGRSIYRADRGHTYHRLLAIGLPPNQAVMTIHLTSLLLGCLAFIAMNLSPFISNMLFIGTVLTAIGLIMYLDDRKRWP